MLCTITAPTLHQFCTRFCAGVPNKWAIIPPLHKLCTKLFPGVYQSAQTLYRSAPTLRRSAQTLYHNCTNTVHQSSHTFTNNAQTMYKLCTKIRVPTPAQTCTNSISGTEGLSLFVLPKVSIPGERADPFPRTEMH
jgi:hypothetical protein